MIDPTQHWYRPALNIYSRLLLPLSWLFRLSVRVRRHLYSSGIKKVYRCSVPVIVVGNITVGGTGKTPSVIWLVEFLQSQGFRPGIVSRGFGGQGKVQWVEKNADPKIVGDEAVLLARRGQCPVVVGINRVAAVQLLLQRTSCNIVISDDGLQHYRLARDLEIAVIDGVRGFGNECFLPAGPLRESISRLQTVDFVLVNGANTLMEQQYSMHLQSDVACAVNDPQQKKAVDFFKKNKVHALAAIGHPQRFFALLRELGLDIIEHVFPDHYHYQKKDIEFADGLPVLMTEKDAVKCEKFADQRHWYLPVTAKMDARLPESLMTKVKNIRSCYAKD